MNRGFVVKVKMVNKLNKIPPVLEPVVRSMKPEFPYAVLSVWNQGKKNEDGTVTIVTKFLIGDQDTGILTWIDSHAVDFVGVI